jgi:DNA repair exonuclease SbcCD nuclease subunit
MKIAVCADLHFRGKKLQDKIKAWESAVDKMIAAGAELVVLAGDVFDTRQIGGREASTGTVYRAFMEGLQGHRDAGIEIVVVQGNHELATGDQLSALEPLKDAGVQVKDEFGLVDAFADITIAYIPWVADTGTRAEDLKRWLLCIKKAFELKPDKFKLVIGHLTVRGAQLNSGVPLIGSEFEVDPEVLMGLGADLVVLGHIHKRQWFGDMSGDKICYVGALSQGDFGEEGNPQGFLLIDAGPTEINGKMGRGVKYEFVEIDAPRYLTLEDHGFTAEDCPPWEDHYIKLRCKSKPDDYDNLLSSFPNLTIEIVPERVAPVRSVEGVEAGRSDLDMLDSYLVSRGLLDQDRARIAGMAKVLANELK